MSSRIDSYKHLDKETPFTVELSMEQIARQVVQLNYGTHRLLSALVHELRAENARHAAEYEQRHPGSTYGPSELAEGLEKLLNQGLFS
jgi:DNA-directed RNA polymerase subunit L